MPGKPPKAAVLKHIWPPTGKGKKGRSEMDWDGKEQELNYWNLVGSVASEAESREGVSEGKVGLIMSKMCEMLGFQWAAMPNVLMWSIGDALEQPTCLA